MINIKIFKRNANYIGFESFGHAEYSDGDDIVCAGVSTLTQTMYFHLVENLNLDEKFFDVEQRDGYLKLILKNNDKDTNIQVSFMYMIKGLEILEAQYSKYIKLEMMEVQ